MVDVDVRAVWSQGRTEFTTWFTAASLVGNFLFVRISTRFPFARSIAADITMTGVSWLFVCAMPISLFVYVLVQSLPFGGGGDPLSWILVVLMTALTAAISSLAVLTVFGQRITLSAFGLIFTEDLICVGVAVYRMAAYIAAHPPEA